MATYQFFKLGFKSEGKPEERAVRVPDYINLKNSNEWEEVLGHKFKKVTCVEADPADELFYDEHPNRMTVRPAFFD